MLGRLIGQRGFASPVLTGAILTISRLAGLLVAVGFVIGVGLVVSTIVLWRKVNELAIQTQGLVDLVGGPAVLDRGSEKASDD
jgi:hypothetical protein